MIKIMHRLINSTGRYKGRIRASYITSFIKGIMMKVPMVLCFLAISLFMQDSMSKKYAIYLLIGVIVSVILEAAFEHITNVLESAAGYMVFADMRMKLGDHLRKLPMGFFTEGNIPLWSKSRTAPAPTIIVTPLPITLSLPTHID